LTVDSAADQALREANALSADRAASYDGQIGELKGRLEALKSNS
jgi:hypothetical protein